MLLLIVKNDRKIRIEVGYGLEGIVTDALSSSIIRNIITPYFKSGNYYEGISAGIKTLQDAIAGEYQADDELNSPEWGLIPFIIFLLIIFTILPMIRRASHKGWNITEAVHLVAAVRAGAGKNFPKLVRFLKLIMLIKN